MSEQIIQAILDWNPWFNEEFPSELAGYDRNYNLLPLLDCPEIKILEGARRVGKSTLLYQLIQHLTQQKKKVLYLNFDDNELSKHSLKDIYYTYLKYAKADYLFLDEIQQCDQWVHFIRQLYDTKKAKQIWISGSNSSLIKREYKKLLTGRNISLEIYPLSFKEFLQFNGIKNKRPPLSSAQQSRVLALFTDYLNFGAFPAVALRSIYKKELLINYFEDIIYKDIVPRHEVNALKIKEVGLYLTTNNTKNFSYRKIAGALGIHSQTATDYISYFTEVFLFSELYKFDYSLKKQLSSDKKIYAIDTGIAAANAFKFSEDKGRMLENLVHNELKRRGESIYFHKHIKECDFIIKQDLDIKQAIQVTLSLEDDMTKKREEMGLLDALSTYHLTDGLILTLEEEDEYDIQYQGQTFHIDVQPVWKWCLNDDVNSKQ